MHSQKVMTKITNNIYVLAFVATIGVFFDDGVD